MNVHDFALKLGVVELVYDGCALNEDARAKVLACPIVWSGRGKYRLGAAHVLRHRIVYGRYVVELEKLMLHKKLLVPGVEDVLVTVFLHEVAHLIAETMQPGKAVNHGHIWRHAMRTMGQEPNRTQSHEVGARIAAACAAAKQ